MEKIDSFTDLKVSIHRHDLELDITSSVISVTTDKNVGKISGTFNLEVKPKVDFELLRKPFTSREPFTIATKDMNNWMINFKSNALVRISYSKKSNGQPLYTMNGLIDTIHKVKSIDNNNNYRHSIVISGRDFGKILEKNNVTLISNIKVQEESITGKRNVVEPGPVLNKYVNLSGGATRAKLVAEIAGKATVVEAVKAIMKWYQGNFSELKFLIDGRVKSLNNIFDWESWIWHKQNEIVQGISIANSNGTLADILLQIAEKPFYEMFVDTKFEPETLGKKKDTISRLIVRPVPFSGLTQGIQWNDDNAHIINKEEFLLHDISRSDDEVYTAFKVTTPIVGAKEVAINAIYKTIIIKELFEKYGFNLLSVESTHLIYDLRRYGITHSDGWSLAEKKRDNLIKWYKYNDELESGTAVIKINDKIRCGEYLMVKGETTYIYYIEGVKQVWRFGQQTTTHLTLTRGLPLERYAKLYPTLYMEVYNPEVLA